MTMGRTERIWTGIVAAAAALMIAVTFCIVFGRLGQKNEGRIFGAVYMTMNNPFYEIVDDEIRGVLESRGDMLLTRDPALSVEKQTEQIEELVERGVSAIFLNPADWKAIGPAVEKAKAKGIPVIAVDSDIYDDRYVDCTVTTDNFQAGALCARHLMESRDRGKILLLTHNQTKSGIDRIQGFKEALKGKEGFEILAERDCLGQLEIAMPVMKELAVEYPQADVVMCLNDLAAMGVMAALEEQGLTGKMAVYGVDGSPDGKSMISAGIMTATAAQFPRQIGRRAAEAAYDILDGTPAEKEIKIPPRLITKEELQQYGTDGWQ